MELSQSTEMLIRFGCFVGLFGVLAALESWFPRRVRGVARRLRWPSNLGISVVNQILVRLILPASAMALAVVVEQKGWGLLGLLAAAPWLEILLAVLVLDLTIYWQHRAFHAVPVLWRFHRMHHADTEFDVTTGIRFHPLSILPSAFIKLGAVLIIGPAPLAVLIFEVLLNATSLFNHSNLRIPLAFDRILRFLVVTPDMHRVHHSIETAETNRNFGFNFPLWDRLFRSYQAQPAKGHTDMVIGLQRFREPQEQRLDRLLLQPFRPPETDSESA
jgi:sterol desaturase/sphingolipid hydroxylase (fatty acid hydroxylase superfamily)